MGRSVGAEPRWRIGFLRSQLFRTGYGFLHDRRRIVWAVVVVRFSFPFEDVAGRMDGVLTRSWFRARVPVEARLFRSRMWSSAIVLDELTHKFRRRPGISNHSFGCCAFSYPALLMKIVAASVPTHTGRGT